MLSKFCVYCSRCHSNYCCCCFYFCRSGNSYQRRSCCREAVEVSTGELLEAAWRLHSLPLEMPWRLPEALGEPLARLGRSGDRPGCVSGALGVVLGVYKRCLGHSLGRLGAILGAKRAPEGSSRGVQIELKRRLELRNASPRHFMHVSQHLFTFEVPGCPFGGEIRCKM